MKDEMLSAKSCIQLESCQASIEIMEQCCCTIELLEEMLEKGSSMLVSDVGCGAILCQAALRSAGCNVLVNTNTMADRQVVSRLNRRVNEMCQDYLPRAEAVARTVETRLYPREEGAC